MRTFSRSPLVGPARQIFYVTRVSHDASPESPAPPPPIPPPSPPVGVALLGHGTVGRGVVTLLAEGADDLCRRTGLGFDLRHVVVRDLDRHREQNGQLPLTGDAGAAVTDSGVDVVVELIGGTGEARQWTLTAFENRKHVVTANKALVAAHGPELFAAARRHGVCYAFEASCGGGLPIVGALAGGLLANRVDALVGILNGTTNGILTAMSDRGESYDAALKEAQDQGFAEADPTLDVSGRDAAQKLAILAGLAMNRRVDDAQVHVEGIDAINPLDIAHARDLGYVVKLLATARRDEAGRLELSVFPGLLAAGEAMSDVKGPFNAVSVYGHALGHAMFVARGAGQMPTASAVVADLIQVGLGTYPRLFERLRIFPDTAPPAEVVAFGQTRHRYYLRLAARDVPGVLADVTRALGDAGISLSAVQQRERVVGDEGFVPVLITTHLAREDDLRRALAEIDALPGVRPPGVVLRIVDLPREAL